MDGDNCPALDFIMNGEESTEATRQGLLEMLQFVAENGLDNCPGKWIHEANKQENIYEFIKGKLRLFFFKGKSGQIAVCTSGKIKDSRKADKASVKKASTWRKEYLEAIASNTLTVEYEDED